MAKDLRNHEKRRTRLRKRAKLLSDQDLVQVLILRKEHRASKAKNGAASSSSSSEESTDAESKRTMVSGASSGHPPSVGEAQAKD